MNVIPKFNSANVSAEILRKKFESLVPNDTPIKESHQTQEGKYIEHISTLSSKFNASLEFWSSLRLPDLPEVFVPDSQTDFSPRSKLDEPVNE